MPPASSMCFDEDSSNAQQFILWWLKLAFCLQLLYGSVHGFYLHSLSCLLHLYTLVYIYIYLSDSVHSIVHLIFFFFLVLSTFTALHVDITLLCGQSNTLGFALLCHNTSLEGFCVYFVLAACAVACAIIIGSFACCATTFHWKVFCIII